MGNKWEIGKQVQHQYGKIFQVVGKTIIGGPILQEIGKPTSEPFAPRDLAQYERYTPPPPNVIRYHAVYMGVNGPYLGAGFEHKWDQNDSKIHRVEVELTHDGKFVSAKSVM